MSKQYTFAEAKAKMAPVITTSADVGDVIQEAVDSIYESGRWPGTTVEIELAEAMFALDDDENQVLSLDDTLYNGAIGFRSSNGGWSIRGIESLYKDGVNSGDLDWIDLGSFDVVVDELVVKTRKYRAPLGFVPSAGPYYCLLKKEPPQMHDDDLVPVESMRALKHAVRAICYEWVADDERAQLAWNQFGEAIMLSTRQVEGPKKYYAGMDSSLRRRPQQFN